ncbi:MAG: hypothetical protein IJL52_00025 [Clostridia bacterium]|nr:hypothetical protein [Clostridia bacterium]
MKYQIKKLQVNQFDIISKGKLSARSYFIPYRDRALLMRQTALTERFQSDCVTVLSGDWDFRYYERISRLPQNIDTDKLNFDTVTVPSTWQHTGYEKPVYLNSAYEFPTTPPLVPEEMSCSLYRKTFTVNDSTAHTVLSFLGVCSCLTLYVNGQYVGYSEGSHNMAEFLLDGLVHPGENELLAIVTKWCNGSYLECQDMFRENGIFRDVYLTQLPATWFWDIAARPIRTDDGWELSVNAALRGDCHSGSVTVALFDGDRCVREQTTSISDDVSFLFGNLDIERWSAETPKLYDLLLTLQAPGDAVQNVRLRIGFKTVRIDGERFLFNDALIKFKGVNHHDTHPVTGYVMSPADLEKDVRLMKEYNVNAVRTSHYPPDPLFLSLCDEYGLYVIDEADIETHGLAFLKWNMLSNDRDWLPRYLERVTALFERDKNHPAVTMWSLGNEAGGWKNQDACAAWLHERSDLPVHYEGVIRTPRGSYDVISEMYQSPMIMGRIAKHGLGPRYKGKPYFLCEYCHAMGLGPGGLEDYWKLIYDTDQFIGGCIWEWADHSVFDKNAKYQYTYGGDHGEKNHDGNFCVDGLFYPDRTPHTGARAMKATYRPIRAAYVSDNLFRFTNTNRFLNANIYQTRFELRCDGVVIDSGTVALDIPPRGVQSVVIAHTMTDPDHDYFMDFIYTDANGHEVAREQLPIQTVLRPVMPVKDSAVAYLKKGDNIIVAFECGRAVFDKHSGTLVSYVVNGKELLADGNGLLPIVDRAPLDNDRNKVRSWEKDGLNRLLATGKRVTSCVNDKGGFVSIKTVGALSFTDKRLFHTALNYRIFPDGTILVDAVLSLPGLIKRPRELSRFGVCLHLDETLQNVCYYGAGPYENLPDFRQQSTVGIYESTVRDLCENYIKPQENGMHMDTRFVRLTDDSGAGVEFHCGETPLTFSARPYKNKTLKKAQHREDLRNDHLVCVNIDGFVRGTGTDSCGPDVLAPYELKIRDSLRFSFSLRPVKPAPAETDLPAAE